MKENFKPKIHIRNNLISEKMEERIINHISKSVEKEYLKSKENSFSPEESLGDSSLERIKAVYDIVRKNYEIRGIHNLEFGEAVFSKEKAIDSGCLAHSKGYIELFDLDIKDHNLKQLAILKNLGHELYHDAAKHSFDLKIKSIDNHQDITYQQKNVGAGYSTGESRALEEGSAMLFEAEVFNEIRKKFPFETLKLYDQTIIQSSTSPESGTDHLNILKYDSETRNASVSENFPYNNSKLLVKYLETKIPNFRNLLEKARMERRTLDLARAIEEKFGEGMYRKVTTCTPKNAESLLNELKLIN